ncbi:MAG: hypothetical protein DMG05_25255, partial [Acidobacteria bacterium]
MCVIEKVYQKANRRLGWSCLLAFIACSTGKFAAQTQTVPPALAELKLQLERGEFEPASRTAGSILAAPQADLDTLLQAGQLLSQYRRYDLAREAFMRAREIDPGSFAAAFNLGYIAFQQGKWQEAEGTLKRSLQLSSGSPQVRILLGCTFIREGKKAEGLRELHRAESTAADNAKALEFLASQYNALGMHDEAARVLRQLVQADTSTPEVYLLLVQTYRDAGEYTKALDSAQESARRFPDSAQMNFLLGTQLQGLGQFEQSRPYFEKALSLVPNFGEAYAALGE